MYKNRKNREVVSDLAASAYDAKYNIKHCEVEQ